MSEEITKMAQVDARRLRDRLNSILVRVGDEDCTQAFAVAIFVLTAALMFMYRPLRQPELGDGALYDYIGQSILRGQLPYRDVVDIKTPGSMYLSAFAMAVGGVAGVRDVIAVRLFQILLFGLLATVTFFVCRSYLRNSMAALIAALFPLMSSSFAEWTVAATQPKLPMILFGMLALLCIAKDKPFLAGASSILSFLCWQPGLLFTGVAFLIFSRYLTRWLDGRALTLLAGAALTLAVVVGYFYSRGALGDLWAWTIAYNYSVFWPETQRTPWQALMHLWRVTNRIFGVDVAIVLMALVGFFAFGAQRIRARLKGIDEADLFRDAILIPPVIYFAFCIMSMQAGPDLIPFFPFIGIFAGLTIVEIGRLGVKLDSARRRWDLLVPAIAVAVILALALGRGALAYRKGLGFTLQDQDRSFKELGDVLGPDGKIYVQGPVELLVVLNRPNLSPYLLLNKGLDDYAAARRGVYFATIIGEMESQRPKLVALSRLQNVKSRELLQQWVAEHYDRLESFRYTNVYIRKTP